MNVFWTRGTRVVRGGWCGVEVLKQADIAEGIISQGLGLIQALNPRGVGGNDYKAY